jgi:hypothetical protein
VIQTRGRLALVLVTAVAWIGAVAVPSGAAVTVQDLEHGTTAESMAMALVGSGVTISNVTYSGANTAAGTFTGGTGSIGFESGIILSTGRVQTVDATDTCSKGLEGPNQCDQNSTSNGTPGDPSLDPLASFPTQDAAVLEFDFVPVETTLQFDYVFSSDEYNEFANSQFNDVFAFFVNGTNCAVVPGTNPAETVSINTINGGNPLGTDAKHPELYRNNDPDEPPSTPIDSEMDGLTTVLPCSATVNPGVTNHMKLAIADASDSSYDSNVFLRAGSLVSGTTTTSTPGQTTTSTPGQTTTTSTPAQTTTTSTPGQTTTTTPAPTPTTVGGAPGNNNTNTNTDNNSNENDNSNDQNQTNNQTQTGGSNTNTNANVVTLEDGATNFDHFRHRGTFRNVDHGEDGGHFNEALARTGSDSNRLTRLALFLLGAGALLLATLRVAPSAAGRPRRWGTWRRLPPNRRWR